ncbi:MAG TPA: hypothetical protein ENK26_03735 [Gammaproteobacteria bacterium]|nr:hypothetical protein [Gammaproteobacteria bacterium]
MDEFFNWDDDLLIGVADLDEQHEACARLLERLFRVLFEAENSGDSLPSTSIAELSRLFEDLHALISEHFLEEETLMREVDFPGRDNHIREHNMLRAELLHYKGTLLHQDGGLDIKMLMRLKKWFVSHIVHKDRDFADFLKTREQLASLRKG